MTEVLSTAIPIGIGFTPFAHRLDVIEFVT
jgi:hypothetical protein